MPNKPRPVRSLRTQMAITFGGLCALIAICLSMLAGEMLKLRLQQQAAASLAVVAHNAATLLNDEIAQQSHRAQVLARSKELWEEGLASRNVRTMLERTQHINPHIVWIGITDREGIVHSATHGMLQGHDVSARPWFQHGLLGPYISEVHPAKLLADLLPRTASGEPLRLVDFSAPIYNADGSVRGVLAIHSSWDWVRDSVERLVQGPGQALQQTIFIFDHQGHLIYAPAGITQPYEALGQSVPLSAEELRAASQAQPVQAQWKDREEPYLTAAAQLPAHVTDLGWWIVARQPIETAYASANRILWRALVVGLVVGFLGALVAWLLARRLSNDLKALGHAAQRISDGDKHVQLPLGKSNREVQQLSTSMSLMTRELMEANKRMEQEVRQRTLELQHANTELARQASTDPLTQLLNRRGFTQRAHHLLAQAQRSQLPVCALSLDIDFFKRINDTYGHDSGDAVLQQFADTIAQRVRQTDLVARFGGEEFVVLLPDTAQASALQLAQHLRQTIADMEIEGVGHITTSIGLSSWNGSQGESLESLLKRSDAALYEAKHTGRNRVCIAA